MTDLMIPTKEMTLLEPERSLTPSVWHMIQDMAPVMYKSRLFGVTSSEAAAAILLKGFELGLGFTASFELVQVVQGKPALSPRGAMALLLNSPKIKNIKITRLTKPNGDFLGYECFMERDNGFSHTARFTMDDAARAGVVKPGSGWANYPENMCLWRSVGFCADVVAPDITAGLTTLMKMPEQFGIALSSEGDVIDAQAKDAVEDTTTNTSEQQPAVFALDFLLAQYGPEAIMVANEGRIPATDEEITAVAKKLGAQ